MQQVSNLYKSIESGNHRFEQKIDIGSKSYLNGSIEGAVRRQSTLFDDVAIGCVISKCLTFTLKTTDTIPRGAEVEFSTRAVNGSSQSEWLSQGTFYIFSREDNQEAGTIALECYDALLKADVPFWESGTWVDQTALNAVRSICSDIGVSLASTTVSMLSADPWTVSVPPMVGPEGTTDREMLSYIASRYGCNVLINNSGELEFIELTRTPEAYDLAREMAILTRTPAYEAIDRVLIYLDGENVIKAPATGYEELTGRVLELDNPYGTQDMANAILDAVRGYVYKPFTAESALIPPYVEVGDRITVDGVTSILADQTTDYDSLIVSSAAAPGKSAGEDVEYPYIKSVTRNLTAKVNGVLTYLKVIPGQILGYVSGVYAEEYDTSETYQEGDYCIYEGKYYRCLQNATTGDWNPSKWEETSYSDITESLIDVELGKIELSVADSQTGSSIVLTKDDIEIATPSVYFRTNDAHFSGRLSAEKVEVSESIRFNSAIYGTCSTPATTDVKVVECPDFEGIQLKAGMQCRVKFTNASATDNVLLNVGGTGAGQVKVNGTTFSAYNAWRAGGIVTFTFDGTYWCMDSEENYMRCTSAASTLAKTVSNVSGLSIADGTKIRVRFTNASPSSTSGMTLAIGSTGAKYFYGSGDLTQEFRWNAGDILNLVYNYSADAWIVQSGDGSDSSANSLYGTCTTGTTTAAKVVTCPQFKNLVAGSTIRVKMSNYCNVEDITLNVNGTGAHYVLFNGLRYAARGAWNAGDVVTFDYDGTNWCAKSDSNNVVCQTSAGTSAKVAAQYATGVQLQEGMKVRVYFRYQSTAIPTTLKIGDSYAITMHLNGASVPAKAWQNMAVVTFTYDGTYWNMDSEASQQTASEALDTANSASQTASSAQSTADSAKDIIDDWKWVSGDNTYIDSNKIYVRTLACTEMFGEIVNIYGSDENTIYGKITTGTEAESTAFELLGTRGIRIKSSNGYNVFINSGSTSDNFLTLSDSDSGVTAHLRAYADMQFSVSGSGDIIFKAGQNYDTHKAVFDEDGFKPYYKSSSGSGVNKLGTSTYYWGEVYCYRVHEGYSDRRMKSNIDYDFDIDEFFDKLSPASFTMDGDKVKRTHYGFIAQDVEQALINSGMSYDDFSGLLNDEDEESGGLYRLFYNEFIALCVDQIQKLKVRVSALEGRLN